MLTLHQNIQMPMLGLGLFDLDAQDLDAIIPKSIECGYTLFDTATRYGNEKALGDTLKKHKIAREKVFLTTKIWGTHQWYEPTKNSVHQSLKNFQSDYIDLVLIHWPGQNKERYLQTYRALEDLKQEGKIRAIGLSNFMPKHLDDILENCRIKPALNQIQRNPYMSNEAITKHCKARQVPLQAWSALGGGGFSNVA